MEDTGKYKRASALVDEQLEIHAGEQFTLDSLCRWISPNAAMNRDDRKLVAIKLSYEVKHQKLEKNNILYRVIDHSYKDIDWVNADPGVESGIQWPYGIDDGTRFGFDGHVVISQGQTVVLAGKSNSGKTTFCLNLLWENMDTVPCTLMGNEYTPANFKRRTSRMAWADPLKDGKPKFELIERFDNWKDIIRPDNLNIIDWINLGDNFYQIGKIIEGIQAKLKTGVAVICIQTAPGKELGLGGAFSIHLASLYLSIDYERMTVLKAKEWNAYNPNNDTYGFEIVNHGTQFHRIRKIKKCPKCWGTGKSKGQECPDCIGKGWIDED